MVIDHLNVLFLGHELNGLWKIGRIAFPLFAFALAINLLRGNASLKYVATLSTLGVFCQPVFASVMDVTYGNVLFTLAASIGVAILLLSRSLWVQHAVFLASVMAIFTPFLKTQSGIDFGLAGVMFPIALSRLLDGCWSYVVWALLLLVGLNWYQPNPWEFSPINAALFAFIGSLVAILLALAFTNRARFLPRYFFYAFYPAHLLILSVIHRLM
jgi:hypothetical protein